MTVEPRKRMTVGELRKALEGVSDEMEITVVVSKDEKVAGLYNTAILTGFLRSAKVEDDLGNEPPWLQLDAWDDEDEEDWTDVANEESENEASTTLRDRARAWLLKELSDGTDEVFEADEDQVVDLAKELQEVWDAAVERCADRLERLGEKGPAGFLRFVPEEPLPLTPEEEAYGRKLAERLTTES